MITCFRSTALWLLLTTYLPHALFGQEQAQTSPTSNILATSDDASLALSQSLKDSLVGDEILFPLLMALMAGLLSALSPCVYPLIPITLSVMGARRYQSRIQGTLVALSYVAGMSLLYTLLGIAFASMGMMLGSFMQSSAVLIVIGIFFVLMCLFMVGAFKLVMPDTLMVRLSNIGGQGLKGAFLMGLVAGVLAAPCTGPVLSVILTMIAKEQDPILGSSLMMAFSLGMGVPFLLLGTFSSLIAHIPRSGPWMDRVKLLLGTAMLGAAFYYLAQGIPSASVILTDIGELSWPVLVIIMISGLLLLLLSQIFMTNRYGAYLGISLGMILSASMVASLISPDRAIPILKSPSHQGLSWLIIDSNTTDTNALDQLLLEAKNKGQPVVMDFYADWCAACKKLEGLTFTHAQVLPKLQEMMLIRIDCTKNSDLLVDIQARFLIRGLPTVVLIDAHGDVDDQARVTGFMEAKPFLERLKMLDKATAL